MPKIQPLEKQPQQHQLDAYGGIETGTSQYRSDTGKWLRFA